jgi:hypothetical protein
MNPEDILETPSCCSCCCERAVDTAPVIEEPIVPDPAPVVETPAPAVEAPVAEAPAPVLAEPTTAVEAPALPEPNYDVIQTAPAPEPDAFAQLRQDLGSATVVGGPMPDAFSGLNASVGTTTVVGGPAPDDFPGLGHTVVNSTVVGGPIPNEFAGIGQPLAQHGPWGGPADDFLMPDPNRVYDPISAMFAPQAWQQWGNAMGQLQAAALNSALLGPADHTAQYSRSLGVDWVRNGRDHV